MPKSRKIQRYGWQRDIPDQRDLLFHAKMINAEEITLPPSVDLRPMCSPVEDQGELGSCTANALVGALEYLEKKDGVEFTDLSRLFIYYGERVIEGSVKSDSGAQIRDGIKTLKAHGVCSEASWPYDISKFTKKPKPACFKEALTHTISAYHRLSNINDMKTCLASGYPFVFGITVYESLESEDVAKTGVVPMPDPNEQIVGGHAICAVGYDDASQRFIIRNSWGTGWGMEGYFTIPYDYVTNHHLASDFWMISKAQNL
jgi:C1A family cysteine protease